jgi:hypothetical protein
MFPGQEGAGARPAAFLNGVRASRTAWAAKLARTRDWGLLINGAKVANNPSTNAC